MAWPDDDIDHIVFETGLVRIGAFRCHPDHPSFHDSGPIKQHCFVFPWTAVEIQHEHEPGFVGNPNVVTLYNLGQRYVRNAISPEGDNCDWFGVESELVRDVVSAFDSHVDDHAEQPFIFMRGWSDASTYLLQRRLFTWVTNGEHVDPLAVEETVIELLDRVVRSAYSTRDVSRKAKIRSSHRDTVHDVETILSGSADTRLSLKGIARDVGLSAYHLCRLFRRVTGMRLHQYRLRFRLRQALSEVVGTRRPLIDIALDAGFSSHSHFTDIFHNEFDATPSSVRAVSPSECRSSNFLIAPLSLSPSQYRMQGLG